jgi:hypothetical protein
MAFIPAIGAFLAANSGIIAAAGAGLSAVGAIQQGRQQSAAEKSAANMADYQAKVADIHANQVNTAAGIQEDEQRRRARQTIGQQLAASGEAGAGLNGDLLRQSIYGMDADSAAIRYEGALKATGMTDEASLQRSNATQRRDNAKQAMGAGFLSAASALTRGATSYYGGSKLNAGGVT